MFQCNKDGFYIEDDVMVSYSGTAKRIVIPAFVEGNPVKRIGRSELSRSMWPENNEIESVVVEEGIESLEEYCFVGLSPKEFYLPATIHKTVEKTFRYEVIKKLRIFVDRDLTKEEYELVLSSSKKMDDGRRLLLKPMNEIPVMNEINKTILIRFPMPSRFGPEYGCMMKEQLEWTNDRNLYKVVDDQFEQEYDFYGFLGNDIDKADNNIKGISDELIKALIGNEKVGFSDIEEEENAINNLKTKRKMQGDPANFTTFISFDESLVVKTEEGYRVRFLYNRGRAFIPVLKPVCYQETMYYVLWRHYLSSDSQIPFISKITGVYLENGEPAGNVGKYATAKLKLLDLL